MLTNNKSIIFLSLILLSTFTKIFFSNLLIAMLIVADAVGG